MGIKQDEAMRDNVWARVKEDQILCRISVDNLAPWLFSVSRVQKTGNSKAVPVSTPVLCRHKRDKGYVMSSPVVEPSADVRLCRDLRVFPCELVICCKHLGSLVMIFCGSSIS